MSEAGFTLIFFTGRLKRNLNSKYKRTSLHNKFTFIFTDVNICNGPLLWDAWSYVIPVAHSTVQRCYKGALYQTKIQNVYTHVVLYLSRKNYNLKTISRMPDIFLKPSYNWQYYILCQLYGPKLECQWKCNTKQGFGIRRVHLTNICHELFITYQQARVRHGIPVTNLTQVLMEAGQ